MRSEEEIREQIKQEEEISFDLLKQMHSGQTKTAISKLREAREQIRLYIGALKWVLNDEKP